VDQAGAAGDGAIRGLLAYLLRDSETAALVEAAPEAGRILRPLCRLLGVKAPEFLRRGACRAGTEAPPQAPACAEAGDRILPRREETNRADDAIAGEASRAREDERAMARAPDGLPPPASAAPGPVPPQRPLSWLEQDAAAMRERVARWVAGRVDAPSTLLPLRLSPTLAFPGTGPPGFDSKTRR
jgi:hypothetical protein